MRFQSHVQYDARRCCAFVCDVSQEELGLPENYLDVAVLIFVLSAIHPDRSDGLELWRPH